MSKIIDIRDQIHLSGDDILKLNFIKNSDYYVFRKHYRFGLRSHIFEVLLKKDIQTESKGKMVDGVRIFPRAIPVKIFRILRNRFKNIEAVFREIDKYKILLHMLGPDLIAQSEEFIVDYTGTENHQIVLCGLQEYIDGEILDPWRIFDPSYLTGIYKPVTSDPSQALNRVKTAQHHIESFVKRVRKMISKTGFIPDLAGVGNLILMSDGRFKLVDINNIKKFEFNDNILLDDKGYPSCDVSIKVLSILEKQLLQKNIPDNDPLYSFFLSPHRLAKVKKLEKDFYKTL